MSNPVKGSQEWFKAKKEARDQLDAKLAAGLPHGGKSLPIIAPPGLKVPKPAKPRRSKAPKAE